MYDPQYQTSVSVTVSADPGAPGGWSDPIESLVPDGHGFVVLVVSVAGSPITVQASVDKTNWYQLGSDYTAVGAYLIEAPVGGLWLRCGVTDADWSASATATLKR